MRRTKLVGGLSLLLLPVLAVCGGDPKVEEDSAAASWLQVDSAGVQILTSTVAAMREVSGWVVEPTPEFVIGDRDDPRLQLYRADGVQGWGAEGFVLSDGGSRQLRFFDAAGNLTSVSGQHGEGPGEFSDPVLVGTRDTDSLLVWDRDLHRFQVFGPSGEYARTIRLGERWPAGGRPPLGAVMLGTMLVESRWHEFLMVPRSREIGGAKEERRDYFWYEPESGERTVLSSFSVLADFQILRRGLAGIGDRVPFVPQATGAVGPRGAFITDGAAYEIREYGADGSLRRVFRVKDVPDPVTEALLDRLAEIRAREPQYVSTIRERYADMPIPELLPGFDALVVDDLGWLWARVFHIDPVQAQSWVLFDPEGRVTGTVETPPGLTVHHIGSDHLIGVGIDEFGVETARRHGLRRSGQAGRG